MQGKRRWLGHLPRRVMWTLGLFLALLALLYLMAVGEVRYEARSALRAYDQLLTVRLGDSVAEFNRKILDCDFGESDGDYDCLIDQPITQRVLGRLDWYMRDAHEDAYLWQNVQRQKIGLRDWYLHVWGTVRNRRVEELHAQFFVTGQDMALGCSWGLTPELDHRPFETDSATQPNMSTSLHVTHITSNWVGWGYRMEFTPQSDTRDLRMREVNGNCLTSYAGCRDSRELLPNLPPPDHPRYW